MVSGTGLAVVADRWGGRPLAGGFGEDFFQQGGIQRESGVGAGGAGHDAAADFLLHAWQRGGSDLLRHAVSEPVRG